MKKITVSSSTKVQDYSCSELQPAQNWCTNAFQSAPALNLKFGTVPSVQRDCAHDACIDTFICDLLAVALQI